ncbi:hypothetical protein ACQ4M4_13700 [Leptolyngbya sp. AN02str]|uniref:hypothetical protein n=1 Tax=Leptolyngbya sp. AN02str TaxID=3423363 RepID=UPI003D31D0B2
MTYSFAERTMPGPLREPLLWGAIASLGVHALLWLLLPLLPSRPITTEAEIQRPVDLIELTPAERSRLPEFLSDELAMPSLPEFNSPPSLQSPEFSLSPIPNQPPVRLSPTLPPFFVPPPPAPSSSAFRVPRTRLPSATSLGRSNAQSDLRQRQRALEEQLAREEAANPSPTPTPTLTPGENLPNIAGSSATPTPSPTPGAADLQTTPATIGQSSPGATPTPASGVTEELLAEVKQRPERYAYDASGTSNDDALTRYTNWFASAVTWMGEDYDPANYGPESAPSAEVNAPIPRQACVADLSNAQPAVIGVAVDADGNVVDEPAPSVLQSTGYPFLNERALEQAQALTYEGNGRKQAYRVTVTFVAADVCEGVTQPAEPEEQEG